MKKTCNHIPKGLFQIALKCRNATDKGICPCEENAGYQMPKSRTVVPKVWSGELSSRGSKR